MIFKNKGSQPDSGALAGVLAVHYRSMPLDKLQEMRDNLVAQVTLINSIIQEKSPDQEVSGNA